jgi:hypothetical protein
LFGQLVDLFGVLSDALQPPVCFLNLTLDLQCVLSGIENSPLRMSCRWHQERAQQHADE